MELQSQAGPHSSLRSGWGLSWDCSGEPWRARGRPGSALGHAEDGRRSGGGGGEGAGKMVLFRVWDTRIVTLCDAGLP